MALNEGSLNPEMLDFLKDQLQDKDSRLTTLTAANEIQTKLEHNAKATEHTPTVLVCESID